MSGMVIIGGGLAGAKTAETLREHGYAGDITLLAGEAHAPYERPPLSKEVLQGQAEAASTYVHPQEWYEENSVDLRTGESAVSIDPQAHTVLTGSGENIEYEKVLLATGSRARKLDLPGSDLPGVFTLRTIDDARSLYDALRVGEHKLVVVGSGWIGMEVAASAKTLGNSVTVIGHSKVPLSRALGEKIGARYQQLHTENGVEFRMHASTEAILGRDRVEGVQVDGDTIDATLVVIAVGAVPNIEVAERSGIQVDNGVPTDASLETSMKDVFAAGDITNEMHPVLDARVRVEHWGTALAQGEAAARSMLGQDVSYDNIPYFYTDQFDLGMELAGYPPLMADADVVIRGDFDGNEYIAFWLKDSKVVGGMNVNIWDVNDTIQELISSETEVTVEQLQDTNVPLDSLVPKS